MTETAATQTTRAATGDWMITATGRRVYPLNPAASEFVISDIAHHLSRLCRYGGAVDSWYSVAEHCCLLSDFFPDREMKRWALLHDAAEAYIGDVIRPLKPSLPQFHAIEAPLERAIWERFGLVGPLPDDVKAADSLIIGDERVALFPSWVLRRAGWTAVPRLGVTVRKWSVQHAYVEFVGRAVELFPAAAFA